jgi:hypothetical protein
MRVCIFCGYALDAQAEVHRSSLCPSCSRELKICLNCRFYRPGAHWDCAETIPEPVAEKDRANFCDYFRFREGGAAADRSGGEKRSKAKQDFRKLFGNDPD